MKHLYLLELFIAMLCVGASTILLNRVFDVMVLKSFVVAFVAVGLGLAFFWIYFVPRAHEKHQRSLSFITSLIVGMGLAPWVVEPIAAPLFVDRAESFPLFNSDQRIRFGEEHGWVNALSKKCNDALRIKLEKDGFICRAQSNITTYSRGSLRIQLDEVFHSGESRGFIARLGWRAQGLWFQVHESEAEGEAYHRELEQWYDDFLRSNEKKK